MTMMMPTIQLLLTTTITFLIVFFIVTPISIVSSEPIRLYGLNYNTRQGADWNWNKCKSREQVLVDLDLLSKLTDRIRILSLADCGQGELVLNAAKELGLKVFLGLWVSQYEDIFLQEKAKLEDLLNRGLVDDDVVLGISVGSESIYREEVDVDENINYMDQIKTLLIDAGKPNLPVSLCDIAPTYEEFPQIISAVDVVVTNSFPFWSNIDINSATDYLLVQTNPIVAQASAQNKKMILGETGWPDDGYIEGVGTASPELQTQYFIQFFCRMDKELNWEYYWFTSINNDWRQEQDEDNTIEGNWGFFNSDLTLKSHFQDLVFTCPNDSNNPTVEYSFAETDWTLATYTTNPTVSPAPTTDAACVVNPGCEELYGNCCPTDNGEFLGCCNNGGGVVTPPPTPTSITTTEPTKQPTSQPTQMPTTLEPTNQPTSQPTTMSPTDSPVVDPTPLPTPEPTTTEPSTSPSAIPSAEQPTPQPSSDPTTTSPSTEPIDPTESPTTGTPTVTPTPVPTQDPTTTSPSTEPIDPTESPTPVPTQDPTTASPTNEPVDPTESPTTEPPTVTPTPVPSIAPTPGPTPEPSAATPVPTKVETQPPSPKPTEGAASEPTPVPTTSTTTTTNTPNSSPTLSPTIAPIPQPTAPLPYNILFSTNVNLSVVGVYNTLLQEDGNLITRTTEGKGDIIWKSNSGSINIGDYFLAVNADRSVSIYRGTPSNSSFAVEIWTNKSPNSGLPEGDEVVALLTRGQRVLSSHGPITYPSVNASIVQQSNGNFIVFEGNWEGVSETPSLQPAATTTSSPTLAPSTFSPSIVPSVLDPGPTQMPTTSPPTPSPEPTTTEPTPTPLPTPFSSAFSNTNFLAITFAYAVSVLFGVLLV